MDVKVNLTGLKELESSIDNAQTKLDDLRKAVAAIQSNFVKVGMEINQPTAGTEG